MGGSQTGVTGVSPASGEEEKRKLLLATAIGSRESKTFPALIVPDQSLSR